MSYNYQSSILESLPAIVEPGYNTRHAIIHQKSLEKSNSNDCNKLLQILAGICAFGLNPIDLNSGFRGLKK